MAADLIDGRKIAEEIHQETRQRVEKLRSRQIIPGIAFIRVGEDPASRLYVSMKDKKAHELGIQSQTIVLSEKNTSQQELLKVVQQLNQNPAVHGILVQAPLPSHFQATCIFEEILPEKDVDGFHPNNFGKLLLGDSTGFIPCTPAGIHQLLIRTGIPIAGSEVIILGRSNIVGKPLAALLLQKAPQCNATVTLLHSESKNIAQHCRRADILIAAMGSAYFVKVDMVKPGATVIDVGISRLAHPASSSKTQLAGDVDFEAVREVAGKITPNPGGVGPMTIAQLMVNTVRACEIQHT